MKNWRFWFGAVFGSAAYHVFEVVIEWPALVEIVVCVVLLFAIERIVHKIAVS